MGIEVTWGLLGMNSKLLSDFQYLYLCAPHRYPLKPLVKDLFNGDITGM